MKLTSSLSIIIGYVIIGLVREALSSAELVHLLGKVGACRSLVVATAMQTEFGKIAQLLQTVETGKTPLQHNLDKVGTVLARAAFVVVALIVALGLLRGQPFIDMLIFGIALAVAVVPEALPTVVTISLAR